MIGFVLVDKPEGPTSHDVVARARRALSIKRIGHAGTLDPPASGLLVLGVGPATRLLRYVQGRDKVYEATGVLGTMTSTLDAQGEVVETREVTVTRADLDEAAARFVGTIEQVPPAVSAVKVAGVRAYKRAAAGEDVQLEPRTVTVHELEVTAFDPPSFSIRLRCSSGTYVRSLIADIGDVLGCGAHVSSLRRLSIGSLTVDDAVAPSDIEAGVLRDPAEVLTDLPVVEVGFEDASRARNGQRLPAGGAPAGEILLVGPDGAVGVFECSGAELRPVTVIGS